MKSLSLEIKEMECIIKDIKILQNRNFSNREIERQTNWITLQECLVSLEDTVRILKRDWKK